MDLDALLSAIEAGPRTMKEFAEEVLATQKKAKTHEFFQEALRLLRVSWKDTDPGKYTAHWYAFKDNRKVWPRELVERAKTDPKPDPSKLCAFDSLDRQPCPKCKTPGLDVGCYQQTEDGPFGDTWMKTRYVLCAACQALYESKDMRQLSSRRF